jgi:hypothetical protein
VDPASIITIYWFNSSPLVFEFEGPSSLIPNVGIINEHTSMKVKNNVCREINRVDEDEEGEMEANIW